MPHRIEPDQGAADQHRVVLPTLCWNGRRTDFHAVTDALLPAGILFRSSVVPRVREDLNCSIRHVGHVQGTVVDAGVQQFVFRVRAQPLAVTRLAQDLLGLARKQRPAAPAVRAHPRIVPRTTDIVVRLPCGRGLPGKLLNVSVSGAAVSVGEAIELGTLLELGRTSARMVRLFEHGIGVAFLEPLDPARVGPDVVL